MESEESSINLCGHVITSEIDAVAEKAERLKDLLEEASSLADELASKKIKLLADAQDRTAPKTLISQEVSRFFQDLPRRVLLLALDVGHLA